MTEKLLNFTNNEYIEISEDLEIDDTFTKTVHLPFTGTKPFRAEDMAIIINDGIKEQGIKYYGADTLEELAQQTEDDGLSMTGFVNDEIVGCGGIRKLWDGTGEAWLFLSPKINAYPIRAYECIRDGLQKVIDENDFRCLIGYGRIGFAKAHTLFRHLGFKPKGKIERFTPDDVDVIVYALIKNRKERKGDGNER